MLEEPRQITSAAVTVNWDPVCIRTDPQRPVGSRIAENLPRR